MFEKLKRAHDIFKATKHKLTEANDNLTHAFEWAQKTGSHLRRNYRQETP